MREESMNVSIAAPARCRVDQLSAAEKGSLWAIVLAGARPAAAALTRRLYGDERPKQYAAVSALARCFARRSSGRPADPRERTVVATLASHSRYVEAELRGAPRPHVLAQAYDRGTAAGVLLPAHWIKAGMPKPPTNPPNHPR